MDNWSMNEIKWAQDNKTNYFHRNMPIKNIRQKNYLSHIFICDMENEHELKKFWIDINNKVAVHEQSSIDSLIERSNFYICFFVNEAVSISLQNEIENDTFCAKKYVFINDNMELDEKCKVIEEKIFSIIIDSPYKPAKKVKNIELKNFRVYEGRNQINLCIDKDRPASFVTIYAPNGVGKTSIFDGLEYAFKGEIGRFKEIQDKELGAIYHNRKNYKKNAYVEILLDSGEEIRRNVATVKADSNDIRRNRPVKGNNLVGKPEKWEQIILPHDKIDNFITAKSGEARYKEWMGSTNIEASFDDDFTNSYKEMQENEKYIKKIDEEINVKKNSLNELIKQTSKIELWKNLISEYNNKNEHRKLYIWNEEFKENDYDYIKNSAAKYIREYEIDVKNLNQDINIAHKVLEKTIEYYIECIERINHYNIELENINKKIESRKKYDDLKEKNKYYMKEIETIEKNLQPINEILAYGLDMVYEQKENYLLRKQQIYIFENLWEERSKHIILLDEQIKKVEKEIENISNRLIEEEKNRSIRNNIKMYLMLKDYFVKINEEENIIFEKEKNIKNQIKDVDEFLKQLKNNNLPESISVLKLQDIRALSDYIDERIIDDIKTVCIKYESTIKLIEMNQEKNKRFRKDKEDLNNIVSQGQEYINKHQDLTQCPLCHTEFMQWNKLFNIVNSVEKGGEELLIEELIRLRSTISELIAEYADLYQVYNKAVNELICKCESKFALYKKSTKELITEKNMLKKKKATLIDMIEEKNTFFEKEKIEILATDDSTMKEWNMQQQNILSKLKNDKNQYLEEVTEVNNENSRIEKIKLDQEKIHNNQELYKHINFLINESPSFDLIVEKFVLNEKLEKAKNEINKNKQMLLDLNLKEEESITYLLQKKVAEQKLLEDDMKLGNESKIFNPLTRENVEEKLSIWEKEIENFNDKIDLLNKIIEENGIRYYYKELENLNEEIANKLRLKERELEKKLKFSSRFEESKRLLQEKLKDYFSQTIISEVFQKIDPHQTMKNIQYEFDINQDEKPELSIRVTSSDKDDSYRPEWFFSSAQLNMVAFSSFFSRALQAKDLPINTIFIDDPISHFDDINILGFSDLLRSVMEVYDCQIVLTTHDDKVFKILERKLSKDYYYSKFIKLPDDCVILK